MSTCAPRRRRRAIAVAVVLGTLAAGCVDGGSKVVHTESSTPADRSSSSGSTTLPTDEPLADPLGDYQMSEWNDCDDDMQCATLEVPLDWSDPTGELISLAVIRRPATDTRDRIGSVLFNPGGPGEPGTGFLRDALQSERIPEGLGERFDLVSWDPRGTGDSAGIRCLSESELLEPDLDFTIDSNDDVVALRSDADEFLAACEEQAGEVLAQVGTRNSARDLDALRAALGDRELTYVGYSYGTTLGAEYARMFPENIRAIVLDGVAPPGAEPIEDTHAQARSFEKNLDAFLDECEARSSCLFGDGDPRAAYVRLVATLESGKRLPGTYSIPDSDGVEHQRRGTVGVGEFYTGVLVTLYARENWVALEQALASATKGDGQYLLYLRDLYAGRSDDGSWSHIGEANAAIVCADQALRPPDADGEDSIRLTWPQELPLLGGVMATGTPGCYGYPKAEEPLKAASAADFADVAPIVVVGSTRDPATPYQQAVDLQKLLPGSSLVTWDNDDHTAYGRGNDCIDDAVTAYLTDLEMPTDGLTCTP